MFNLINELIENKVDDANLDFYTVIIGSQPSKGARSPSLWNKVYKHENKNIKMVPLDVKNSNLEVLFQTLKEDHNCLGGAIAVPYKEKIFNLISENCSEETIRIGAINCFYRSNAISNDDFWGTNTDGEAAIEPIKSFLMESKKLEIGILGHGGAGKAILSFLLRDFGDKHSFQVFNRSKIGRKEQEKLSIEAFPLEQLKDTIQNLDLIINTTSLGHIEQIDGVPVSEEILQKSKSDLIIYDIIYDPPKTKLLEAGEILGFKTINGSRMNLIQAVLAYKYTNKTNLPMEKIFQLMQR